MHGPINVKSRNKISKWQMEFNSAFKGLNPICHLLALLGAHPIFHVSRLTVKVVVKCLAQVIRSPEVSYVNFKREDYQMYRGCHYLSR
jgi:hypothetical protein